MARTPRFLGPSFKVILLGEANVGKSTILYRLTQRAKPKFNLGVTTTLDYVSEIINVDGKEIRLMFWDPAGLEKNRMCITPQLYRGVNSAVFVYDIADRTSFDAINNRWLDECKANQLDLQAIPIVLLGNKSDLARSVSAEEARKYALTHGMMFHEMSAYSDDDMNNVDRIFLELGRILKFSKPALPDNKVIRAETRTPEESYQKKSRCCTIL